MSTLGRGRRRGAIPTAEGAALVRALGRQVGPPYARNPDGLAVALIPWSLRPSVLVKLPGVRAALPRVVERVAPGAIAYEAWRTRHLDEVLLAEIDAGAAQVVLLGAGLDSRAYRFAARLADRKTFEVDHPASALGKRRRVRALFGELPGHVSYVDVDFNEGDLAGRLRAHGYDPAARTVAIWSGVAPYLTPDGVDSTLRWFAAGAFQGSLLVFDYVHQELVDGRVSTREAARLRRVTSAAGEPLRSGIPSGRAAEFLAARGLELACEVTLPHGLGRHGAIAHARVPAGVRPR